MKRDAANFWDRVDHSGGADACWPWTGARSNRGYGVVTIDDVMQRAHRMALVFSGTAIPDGWLACHHCDNPPCCNPAHLFIGTAADNSRDMVVKGRGPSGSQTPEWVAKRVASFQATLAEHPRPLKTHCPHGHEYTPENTIRHGRGRECRICNIASQRERRRLRSHEAHRC